MLDQSGHRRAVVVRTEEQCHALHWQAVSVVHQDVVALKPQDAAAQFLGCSPTKVYQWGFNTIILSVGVNGRGRFTMGLRRP